jgi:hypothetical protein
MTDSLASLANFQLRGVPNFFKSKPSRPAVAALILAAGVIGLLFGDAYAADVSGVLTSYQSSTPIASRYLNFQNVVTGDVYLSPTHSDGSFRASLPPGKYQLRTESGAILLQSIVVDRADIDLGRITELAPFAPARLWQSQSIAPSHLTSPAPSTAYVKTSDTTPLPATAVPIPKPTFDWTKLPPETLATKGTNTITGATTGPLPAYRLQSTALPSMPRGTVTP